MKDFDAIEAAAQPGAAFSNGFEWDCWSAQWCQNCVHDIDQASDGCDIVAVALLSEKTPAEWEPGVLRSLGQRYRCTEFQPLEAS